LDRRPDQPAPLYYVSPGQINLVVPSKAPTSGGAEFEVVRRSTGQILGSYLVPINVVSPGLLKSGTQVAALKREQHCEFSHQSGGDRKPGAPSDGQPAKGQVPTPVRPRVVINPASGFVPYANILYSGLVPGMVGVWQINVRIPKSVPPGNTVPVFIIYRDVPGIATGELNTTIAVKQPYSSSLGRRAPSLV